ncbi:HAD family hydrolase [Trueperella sp. LYQ143]|uniref:HAD family hydrolase n=1 Tax=unclassified Trueperella TaxID=2630174 RepID=UPI0039835046
MLPQAVLFDMDGTLTDSEELWFAAEEEVFAALDRPWKRGDETAIIGMSLTDSTRYLCQALQLEISPAQLGTLLTDKVAELGRRRGMPWRPGAQELLTLLVELQIPSALVTSSFRSFADLTLANSPQGALTVCVTGDEGLAGKPDPEPYRCAAQRLGVDISRCLIFEDSIPGLTAAHASGGRAVGVPLHVKLPQLPGVQLISSLTQVDEEKLHQLMG